MATAAQIQAALATAKANDLTYADMAILLKAAILAALVDGTGSLILPWQSTASDGTSVTRTSIEAAQRLLEFCQRNMSGGVVSQPGEFRSPV